MRTTGKHHVNRRQALGWVGATLATAAGGQPAQPAAGLPAAHPAPADPGMSTDLVKTGLYLIQGGGGNVLLRFSASGLILVDGKLPGNHRALMTQVRRASKMTDLPLRVLLLTGPSEPHAGTNPQFIAAKVAIVAHQNLLNRLPDAARPVPPQAIAFDRDYTLRMGGVEVRMLHPGAARTDSDAVAFFPDLKVLAVGDLFTADAPQIDAASGGSLPGWSRALDEVLALDFDVVVPGHGPLVGRPELKRLKDRIDSAIARTS